MTYKYNELQMSSVIQKLSCKANYKIPIFLKWKCSSNSPFFACQWMSYELNNSKVTISWTPLFFCGRDIKDYMPLFIAHLETILYFFHINKQCGLTIGMEIM
jgi:hypothetical protein